MWSRKPRPVATRARPPPSSSRAGTSMRVSLRRAAHLADALAAHAVVGGGRLAARELGERAQQPVVRVAMRDGHAEAVGQQRLVRERAHHAAPLGEARRRHRASASARARSCPRAPAPSTPGACACPRPGGRARRRRGAALAHLVGLAAGELGRPPPTRTRASRAAAARRARSASAGCASAVADARRAEREALRERARDDQVVVLGDQRREVVAAELDVGLVEHDDARAGRADARARASASSSLAGRVVRAAEPRPRARAAPRSSEPVPVEARGPRPGWSAEHLGAGVAAATAYSWYVGLAHQRDASPRPSASCAHSARHLVAAGPDRRPGSRRRPRSRRSPRLSGRYEASG